MMLLKIRTESIKRRITLFFNWIASRKVQRNRNMKEILYMPSFKKRFSFIFIQLVLILAFATTSNAQPFNKSESGTQPSSDKLIQKILSNNTTDFTWLVNGSNSWEELQNFLPEAKMSGINITVSLLPPSKTPPVCPSASYSEPYQLDYTKWGKEIADLSLRYSNLKGYTIQSLNQNLDLGYLKQNDVDSMQTEAKSINSKLQFNSSPANIFYVDKNAKGNGDGSSWENASQSVSRLPWSAIKAGDTVYVSGGVDSTVYYQDSLQHKVFSGGIVTITKGIDKGYNGKVIYKQQLPRFNSYQGSFMLLGCKNIKLTNISFKQGLPDNVKGYQMIELCGCDSVYIDNDTIITNGNGFGIVSTGNTPYGVNRHIFIQNNYIETLYNGLNDAYGYGQDPIWIGNGDEGFTITENTMITHCNGQNGHSHADIVQTHDIGSGNNLPFILANNLMIAENDTSAYCKALYVETGNDGRFFIYNNILVFRLQSMTPVSIQGVTGGHLSVRMFNNTVLNHITATTSTMAPLIRAYIGIDTAIVENNICIYEGSALNPIPYYFGLNNYNEISYLRSDYNHFYFQNNSSVLFSSHTESSENGNRNTWSEWQALGFDLNSDTGYVAFSGSIGTNKTNYIPSNLNRNGINLSKYFSTDILGNSRPKTGNWYQGAIEK